MGMVKRTMMKAMGTRAMKKTTVVRRRRRRKRRRPTMRMMRAS